MRHEDCGDGMYCGEGVEGLGMCRPFQDLGTLCGSMDYVCPEGASCALRYDGLRAERRYCLHNLQEGEICSRTDDKQRCGNGLGCDDRTDPPRCIPAKRCTGDADCATAGFTCNGAYNPPQCRSPGKVGAPCLTEGRTEDCERGLVCTRNSGQAAVPWGYFCASP